MAKISNIIAPRNQEPVNAVSEIFRLKLPGLPASGLLNPPAKAETLSGATVPAAGLSSRSISPPPFSQQPEES
jgi:hypothetical protein